MPRRDFAISPSDRQKRQATQQKGRATQPNSRYSAKNNVAMRMIATFMLLLMIFRRFQTYYFFTACILLILYLQVALSLVHLLLPFLRL